MQVECFLNLVLYFCGHKELPKENEIILLTLLISKRYIPYTDLRKICGNTA